MTEEPTTTVAWPRVGSRALLQHLALELDAAVRVADEDAVTLALAALPTGAAALPRRGTEMMLRWGDQAGLHERPVVLAGQEGLLLHLGAAGSAETRQRRQFFRAPVTIDLTITDGRRAITGRTVDLSEGGARVVLAGRPPTPPATVTAVFSVDGDSFDLPSRVLRATTGRQGVEAGIAFDELPERVADVIRREVYTAQIDAMSSSRRWTAR